MNLLISVVELKKKTSIKVKPRGVYNLMTLFNSLQFLLNTASKLPERRNNITEG